MLDPQLITVAVLTTGLGAAMVLLGARLHLLEPRKTPRRCPACGIVARRDFRCGCSR